MNMNASSQEPNLPELITVQQLQPVLVQPVTVTPYPMQMQQPMTPIQQTSPARRGRRRSNASASNKPPKPLDKICSFCGKAFAHDSRLAMHVRIHTGEKPFKCEFCPKAFTQKGNLKKHRRIHTGEKPFQCTFCQYRCGDQSSLNDHIRTHTNEKRYKCQYCDKRFVKSSTYRDHERIHTGEKPYECTYPYCGRRFTRRGTLKEHMKRKHNVMKVPTLPKIESSRRPLPKLVPNSLPSMTMIPGQVHMGDPLPLCEPPPLESNPFSIVKQEPKLEPKSEPPMMEPPPMEPSVPHMPSSAVPDGVLPPPLQPVSMDFEFPDLVEY